MTKENKELLVKDLCARLPYGVVVNYNGLVRPLFGIEPTQHFQITLDNALDGEHNGLVYVSLEVDGEELKPYLRPMSSMTEEEEKEICQFMKDYNLLTGPNRAGVFCGKIVDWLNAHHFDYHGLIEKSLALEAHKDMYKMEG